MFSWRVLITFVVGALVLTILVGELRPFHQVSNSLASQSSLADSIKTIFAKHGISAMGSNKELVDDIVAVVTMHQSTSAQNSDSPKTNALPEQQISPSRSEAREGTSLAKVSESRTDAMLLTPKQNPEQRASAPQIGYQSEESEVKTAKSDFQSQLRGPRYDDQKTNSLQERHGESQATVAETRTAATQATPDKNNYETLKTFTPPNGMAATQANPDKNKNETLKTFTSPNGILYKPIGCGTDDLTSIQKLLTSTGNGRITRVVPVNVGGKRINFHIYGSGDIVSTSIAGARTWEPGEINQVIKHLRQGNRAGMTPLLLDVGANIGWFGMSAALNGFDVIGFEPFAKNVYLQRNTMCDKSNGALLKKHVNLYMMGLDSRSRRCETWQNPSVNFGDTVTICDDTPADRKQLWRTKGFVKLSDCPTATLDDALAAGIFPRKVTILKIDIEGYEPKVLAGARKFFASEFAPDTIMMEAVIDRLEDALGNGRTELSNEFKLLLDYGYVTGGMDSLDKIDRAFARNQGNPVFRRKGTRIRRLSVGVLPSQYAAKDEDVNDHPAEATSIMFSFQRMIINGHHEARSSQSYSMQG